MYGLGVPEIVIIIVIAAVLIWPWWRIFSQAGYPGWFGLSQILPGLNVVGLLFLAFAQWPAQRATIAAESDT
jgi:hypothetical protein